MDLSQNKKREAKKLGVTEQYLIILDLLAAGYTQIDAYTIAYPENAMLSEKQNNRLCESIISSEKFRSAQEKYDADRGAETEGRPGSELMGKEQTAKLIMRAAMRQPADSKERIEGLMKYSDLMGYKKNEVEDNSTDTIQFYLPIKCHQCPLFYAYNMWRKENGEKTIRAIEMEEVIRDAREIIEEAEHKKSGE